MQPKTSYLYQITNRKISTIVLYWTLIALVLLSACSNSPQSTNTNSISSSSPASWSTQLNIAQQAAQAIDPQAVLTEVDAMPLSPTKGVLPLRIRFEFLRPSQDTIRVTFVDTSIKTTIETTPNSSRLLGKGYPSEKDQERLREALAKVKISATEAMQNTLVDGQSFAERENEKANVIVSLRFDQQVEKRFDMLVLWNVVYLTPQKELRIWVDASSGRIIKQEERSL